MQIEKIEVKLIVNDKVFEGEIDKEEYFVCALLRALRNGKDPVDALAFLADEGARNLKVSIGEINRLGP